MAKNTTDSRSDENPFLTQMGLLNLHTQARAALGAEADGVQRAHLKHTMPALLALAERHGPTPEFVRYVNSVESSECLESNAQTHQS
jgi:hypothetical protein